MAASVSDATSSALTLSWVWLRRGSGAPYTLYRNGTKVGSTSSTSYTFSGLACGTAYTLGVHSSKTKTSTSASGSTSPCLGDLLAPSAPPSLAQVSESASTISLDWTNSSDNVGVSGYDVYRNGAPAGKTSLTSYTLSGLSCGTSYTVAVDAYDGAGNISAKTTGSMATAACPSDTLAPSVPTSETVGPSTATSVGLAWTASTDNVGVAGYYVWLNNAKVGSTTATNYSFTGLSCGTTYALGVQAFDAAGNTSAVGTTAGATVACPSTTASVFMSATGSDANACTQAAPCLSFQRAFNVAQPGATVAVAAGHYAGGQTLTGTKSAPGVVFALDPNAVVGDISGTGQLNVRASYVEFDGGQIPAVAMENSPVSDHVVFRNVDGGRMYINNASTNISWIGGDLGPNKCSGSGQTYLNTVQGGSNILFDGVAIHDQRICVSGEHTESLRIDAGSSNITVRNSRFYNNDDSTSAIFVTTTSQGVNMPHDLTVENNFFGKTAMGCCAFETQNPNVTVCTNYVIQYNSFSGSDTPTMMQCPSSSNVRVRGNVGSFQSCDGGTWTYNVMQWSSRPTSCDATNKWVSGPNWSDSALGYVDSANTDFHLLPGSPAINAGDPATYPATDIDRQTRPLGGTPDAGADESG